MESLWPANTERLSLGVQGYQWNEVVSLKSLGTKYNVCSLLAQVSQHVPLVSAAMFT